jgi:UDP-N-acetyl-D-mannosaminuronate dehydrogenase
LGLAFKANVDDLRESPAIDVAHLLANAGALVSAYEPYKPDYDVKKVTMTHSLEVAVKDAEMIVLLVGHDQFKTLDPHEVKKLTSARVVLDTVNGWKESAWQEAGFKFVKLGRGTK